MTTVGISPGGASRGCIRFCVYTCTQKLLVSVAIPSIYLSIHYLCIHECIYPRAHKQTHTHTPYIYLSINLHHISRARLCAVTFYSMNLASHRVCTALCFHFSVLWNVSSDALLPLSHSDDFALLRCVCVCVSVCVYVYVYDMCVYICVCVYLCVLPGSY